MEYFNLHTHKCTNQTDVVELVNQYPQEFDAAVPHYSIGIHPWYIVENRVEADLKIIESKMQECNCHAIGECGLDKRIQVSLELQQIVFEKQLLLAEKYSKPVVVHCVAAFQELIAVKKKLNISVPMIVHGFSKNNQIAKQLLDNGFYLSFGKYLLQPTNLATALIAFFQGMPNNRIFLETDTGKETISEVYELAAKYKNSSVAEMQKEINKNVLDVFNME